MGGQLEDSSNLAATVGTFVDCVGIVVATNRVVIAIDGPAGAGKSSTARALATALGFSYLDSGAMYRCVALLALGAPQRSPVELARAARIQFGERTILNGKDVTEEIRRSEVTKRTSEVAADPEVRKVLVSMQRCLLRTGDWVAEGRDIGTVVAPGAELKVFLTASAEERARRRASELRADLAKVFVEQAERDERDVARKHSPLRAADGAVTIDTTSQEIGEVVARIAALARESGSG